MSSSSFNAAVRSNSSTCSYGNVAASSPASSSASASVWRSGVVSGDGVGDGVGDADDCPLKWSYNRCCKMCFRPFSARSYWLHFSRKEANPTSPHCSTVLSASATSLGRRFRVFDLSALPLDLLAATIVDFTRAIVWKKIRGCEV